MKQWDEWSNAKGMDKGIKQVLIDTATAEVTYKSWYVSEQPVPMSDVLVVENIKTGEVFYPC